MANAATKILHPDFFRTGIKPRGELTLDHPYAPEVAIIFNEGGGETRDLGHKTQPVMGSGVTWGRQRSVKFDGTANGNIDLQVGGGFSKVVPVGKNIAVIIEFTTITLSATRYMFGDWDSAASGGSASFGFMQLASNVYRLAVGYDNSANFGLNFGGSIFAIGKHTAVLYYNTDAHTASAYIEGTEASVAIPGTTRSNGINVRLGTLGDYTLGSFDGNIHSFQVFGGHKADMVWRQRMRLERDPYLFLNPKTNYFYAPPVAAVGVTGKSNPLMGPFGGPLSGAIA